MSKQLRSRLLALLVSMALFSGLFFTSTSAQRTAGVQQNPVASRSARNSAVAAATEAVLRETSVIRQLSIIRPVQSGLLSRAEIERSIIRNLDEDMSPAEAHANEVTLKKLGLAPADFQYRPLLIKVLTEQVAGYYDPRSRQFYLADWIDLDGQKPIMAHELTHALQDQHFDLRRFEHWPKGDSDAELAAHALIEGDATLLMMLYVANNPMRALAFLKSLGGMEISSAELDKAPRALRETLLFPYQSGYEWTRDLYKKGGWGQVSKAFNDLPQSTEQILHPEKYFAHEAPMKVSLPDVAGLINAAASEIRGQRSEVSRRSRSSLQPPVSSLWKRLDYDVEGEWGFYLILDQFLKSPSESHRAAAGWGGDRYEVYEGPKGEVMFVSLSAWDTGNDAREFFEAYARRTSLRYVNAERIDAQSSIRDRQPDQNSNTQALSDIRGFRTSEGSVVLERHGARVLVVEGCPEGIDCRSLMNSLWQR